MSKFNCECNVHGDWHVAFDYDTDAASDGWDGDAPLDETKSWTPYVVIVSFTCNQCGEPDENETNVSGSVWASDDDDGRQYLKSVVDEILPAGVTSEDCFGFWL